MRYKFTIHPSSTKFLFWSRRLSLSASIHVIAGWPAVLLTTKSFMLLGNHQTYRLENTQENQSISNERAYLVKCTLHVHTPTHTYAIQTCCGETNSIKGKLKIEHVYIFFVLRNQMESTSISCTSIIKMKK